MRIYLDSCCLQRPLDNQAQLRVKVETEAVLAILASVQAGDVVLINSEVLEYEIARIPDEYRRNEAGSILKLSKECLEVTDEAELLAKSLESNGIKPIDAVHLAVASVANVDFFTTCDDNFLNKATRFQGLSCKVCSILNLVSEVIK